MSSVAAPYGFKPVGLLSNRVYGNSLRTIAITSGYATAIGYGDAVKMANTGTVAKDTGTITMTPVGIFVGCYYTDPTSKQPSYHQSWPASTVASDAVAYVVDDPDIVFQAQADGSLTQSAVGQNIGVIQTADNSYGSSQIALASATLGTTSTLPIRIIDYVNGPTSALGDAYTDVICIWNWGIHAYRTATGV
jgi:hypothetical protein